MTIERFKLNTENKSELRQKLYLIIGVCMVFVLGIAIFANVRNLKEAERMESLAAARKTVSTPFPTTMPVFVMEDDAPAITATVATPVPEPLSWTLPAKGEIIATFSAEDLVFSRTMNDWRVHLGTDFSGEIGSSVFAVADGTVTKSGFSDVIGNFIEITHADGYVSLYCSLQKEMAVSEGEIVTKGQIIAGIDRSAPFELADPPHLHFELFRNGESINPLDVIT